MSEEQTGLELIMVIYYLLGVFSFPIWRDSIKGIVRILRTPGQMSVKDRLQLEIRRVIEKVTGRGFK